MMCAGSEERKGKEDIPLQVKGNSADGTPAGPSLKSIFKTRVLWVWVDGVEVSS